MPRRFRPAPLVLACLCVATARLAAQGEDDRWVRDCERSGSDAREQYCEVRHSSFKPAGASLSIDPDVNGGVAVEGWDQDTVAISLRIQTGAVTEAEAKELAREISVKASGTTIEVDGPSTGRNHTWSANLWIRVPRKSGLTVATTNGPLSVESVSGRMDLRATNGPITLSSVGGDVRARAQNGPLTVSLTGTSWDGKGLDAETVNGPVTLRVPDQFNANLETGTVNGPMNLGRPVEVTLQGRVRDRIHTTLGKGGAPIRVVTTNGPMTLVSTSS